MVFIVLFTVIAKTQYSQKTGFISLQMPSVFKLNDSLEVIRPFTFSAGETEPRGVGGFQGQHVHVVQDLPWEIVRDNSVK